MTYFGKDVPNSNFNPTAKFEEGILVKGKKESLWTKYYPDGKTPKLKGNYIANEPNGSYEKFYINGVIKEKGVFSNKHYTDTLINYFPNGKISSIAIYDKHGKQIGITKHYYSSGELALAYEMKEDKVRGNVTWFTSSGVVSSQIHVKKQGKIQPIFYNDVAFNSNMPMITNGFNAIRVAGPILKDGPFDPNGYNVVYNKQDELFQVGNFKSGTIYNGKVYNYDTNGILKSISIYRDGFYFSDGKIN
jgi:antitoxin component YwqK of YwqJK toxin-antitoxin module